MRPISTTIVPAALVFASVAAAARPSAEFDSLAPTVQQVEARFQRIEQEIIRLRSAGMTARADDVADELGYFRALLDGRVTSTLEGPELNWIGLYEAVGLVDVVVEATERPVILALTSARPVQWKLHIDPLANVSRVIIHSSSGEPVRPALTSQVPVELYGPSDGVNLLAYRKDLVSFPIAARNLHELSGAGLGSFQGSYSHNGNVFSIGGAIGEWNAQRVLHELQPLYLDATAFEQAQAREAVKEYRFPALLRTPLDQVKPEMVSIAEFSAFGPIEGTDRPSPSPNVQLQHLAVDKTRGRHYGIWGSGAHQIHVATGSLMPLPELPAELPSLTHPSGLAFDTRRERLVLSSLGGHLYGYSTRSSGWSLLADAGNRDITSLAYSELHDALFALSHYSDSLAEVSRYDPDGEFVGSVFISRPLPRFGHGAYQLLSVGDQLGLITPAMGDAYQPHLPLETRFLLINPETGEVGYFGALAIPEPASCTLIAVIACAAGVLRRRKRAA